MPGAGAAAAAGAGRGFWEPCRSHLLRLTAPSPLGAEPGTEEPGSPVNNTFLLAYKELGFTVTFSYHYVLRQDLKCASLALNSTMKPRAIFTS